MICDGLGRQPAFFLSPGQMSDAKGALAPAKTLLADKGYDAHRFREALEDNGISACIPAQRGRKNPTRHNLKLCKQRHRIESTRPVERRLQRLCGYNDFNQVAFIEIDAYTGPLWPVLFRPNPFDPYSIHLWFLLDVCEVDSCLD